MSTPPAFVTGRSVRSRFEQLLRHTAVLLFALALWLSPINGLAHSTAYAYNNPELLPDIQTPVIDLANALTGQQEANLAKDLEDFEQETGWKLRVLTQFERTPGLAVKDYWGLDKHSVLLVADPRGGNLLNFSVGDDFYPLMSRTFWIELQTRFGNQFFVREHGEDQSILEALESIKLCLRRGGCLVVPGLPPEQWALTLITSIVGGVVCGFAAKPRKEGQVIAWQWALIFSPLWGILFIAFGIGPVVTRTSDWLPLFRNIAGFMVGALAAFLVPVLSRNPSSDEV
ncbi:TPM domain-containing protein [Leptolyngbya sp. FACHB-321]|uniref:TPM domain-containing protein n=1 Tax=Leptolyngbya sp. FACHB-321 TaxID=2692807 RepID=UPI0016886035|nr:TPM domain-containing protein [Leptolyngbya sp. FACHB-321]MBD2037167.1 TPM domain-containing protein [Leptolyngbya sp. FACHB-321]